MGIIFTELMVMDCNAVQYEIRFKRQINIYELIVVCLYPRNMRMISETTYSSQTKLLGQSLHVSEQGIGYLDLTFA